MADRETSDAAVLTELDKDNIAFTLLAELQFADGTVNLWLGPKDATLDYLSKIWTGTGNLGSIDVIDEREGIADKPLIGTFEATIAQIDTIELAANEGRDATFYVLLYNTTTGAIIGHIEDPREMGKSWIEPQLVRSKNEQFITSDLKMEFIAEGGIMRRRRSRRLTYTDGLEIDSGDHFLEFSADPDLTGFGGGLSHSTGGGSGGGGGGFDGRIQQR